MVEIYEHDSELAAAFQYAGSFTLEELEVIESHQTTVYLLAPVGQFNQVQTFNRAVGVLLRASGIAVKVESS
ncbi:hypothetical protein [Saccharibacillus sp. JS10]|uniref:hypothetical protein n=1 Tax=Saccharibacillus sp. JS10 TaxID=2950552 RepID=UPI00210AD023|nr:hypothetical protein [Saccharibacillus sp. JS10]MCQ4087538.1 hypothetical protein [Saccharibacillus sp. JS10]